MHFQSVFGADWEHCRCETGPNFGRQICRLAEVVPGWRENRFYEMEIQDSRYVLRPASGTRKTGRFEDRVVSVGLANGTRQEHTSGPGLKVSPQFLSGHRIGYVMKAGPRMGLAFTTGNQGADGQMRNPSWSNGSYIRNGPLYGAETNPCSVSIQNLIWPIRTRFQRFRMMERSLH